MHKHNSLGPRRQRHRAEQNVVFSTLHPSYRVPHPATLPHHLGFEAEPRTALASKGQGTWRTSRSHPFGLAWILHDGRDGGEGSPSAVKGCRCA